MKPGYKPPPAPPKTANRRCLIDNRGINARYLVPIKKGIIVGFCSTSCRGRFLRKPQPYLSKIPGLGIKGRTSKGAPAAPRTLAELRKTWKGPCDVKKLVKGYFCADCKRELEQDDTRNGICKRCEKTPTKIDFCAVALEIIYRAACHPNKTSAKPFRC